MTSVTRKIAEGTFYTFSQKVFTIFLGAVSAIFIIRALGSREYGVVVLALSIVGIFESLLDFGFGAIVVSDAAGDLGAGKIIQVKRLLKDYFKIEVIMGIILSVVVFVFSFVSRQKYGTEVAGLLKIASAMVFLSGIKNILTVTFYSFSKFNFLALLFLLESLFKFVFVLLLIIFLGGGMISVMATYLLASLASILVMTPFFVIVIKNLKGVADMKENLFFRLVKRHGKFQFLSRPLRNILDPLRFWIIQYFAGVNAVAIFQVALKFYGYLTQLVFAAGTPLLSVFSEEFKRNKEVAKKLFERMGKYLSLISIATMLVSFIFAPFVLKLFFGDKYLSSVPLLNMFFLIFIIGGFGALMRPALFALKAQKEILKADLFSALITYPVATFLTFLYGPIGFAVPIGAYLTFIFRYRYLKKIEPAFVIKFLNLLKWDKEDKFLLRRTYWIFRSKLNIF